MRFQNGVQGWLPDQTEEDRLEASEPFREVGAWEEPIRLWTARQTGPFTVADVL